jgi:hypothetical protein
MSLRFRTIALSACLAWPLLVQAAPTTVQGISFDDPIELQGHKLSLNGAGARYKAVFKVYAMGLYLERKASSPEEVLAAPGAKRISITMLREIDANELGKLFTRGVEDCVLQCLAAHLAGPQPGRLEAQGCAVGKAFLTPEPLPVLLPISLPATAVRP